MRNQIKICAIAAVAENNVIGRDNDLLWYIPEDFKYFKATTMGKPMIMGRKTFESLPGMLPGRPHIVVTRAGLTSDNDNLHYVASIEEGIELGKKMAAASSVDEIFFIGGGQIYTQALPLCDRLYITRVHETYEGDAYFPDIDMNAWQIIKQDRHLSDKVGDPAYTVMMLECL